MIYQLLALTKFKKIELSIQQMAQTPRITLHVSPNWDKPQTF